MDTTTIELTPEELEIVQNAIITAWNQGLFGTDADIVPRPDESYRDFLTKFGLDDYPYLRKNDR